jgi:hypothetical protein
MMLRRPVEPKLHAAIGVVDEAAATDRFSIMECLLQRVEHEARVRRSADPPADDAACVGVDDERDVDEAGPSRDVGGAGGSAPMPRH